MPKPIVIIADTGAVGVETHQALLNLGYDVAHCDTSPEVHRHAEGAYYTGLENAGVTLHQVEGAAASAVYNVLGIGRTEGGVADFVDAADTLDLSTEGLTNSFALDSAQVTRQEIKSFKSGAGFLYSEREKAAGAFFYVVDGQLRDRGRDLPNAIVRTFDQNKPDTDAIVSQMRQAAEQNTFSIPVAYKEAKRTYQSRRKEESVDAFQFHPNPGEADVNYTQENITVKVVNLSQRTALGKRDNPFNQAFFNNCFNRRSEVLASESEVVLYLNPKEEKSEDISITAACERENFAGYFLTDVLGLRQFGHPNAPASVIKRNSDIGLQPQIISLFEQQGQGIDVISHLEQMNSVLEGQKLELESVRYRFYEPIVAREGEALPQVAFVVTGKRDLDSQHSLAAVDAYALFNGHALAKEYVIDSRDGDKATKEATLLADARVWLQQNRSYSERAYAWCRSWCPQRHTSELQQPLLASGQAQSSYDSVSQSPQR